MGTCRKSTAPAGHSFLFVIGITGRTILYPKQNVKTATPKETPTLSHPLR
jgi:hypothetical protein